VNPSLPAARLYTEALRVVSETVDRSAGPKLIQRAVREVSAFAIA